MIWRKVMVEWVSTTHWAGWTREGEAERSTMSTRQCRTDDDYYVRAAVCRLSQPWIESTLFIRILIWINFFILSYLINLHIENIFHWPFWPLQNSLKLCSKDVKSISWPPLVWEDCLTLFQSNQDQAIRKENFRTEIALLWIQIGLVWFVFGLVGSMASNLPIYGLLVSFNNLVHFSIRLHL